MNDTASVFSEAERNRLSKLLADYHSETRHQLVVLTIATLSGESIDSYAIRIFNAWGIGYRGLDNGILIVLAMRERMVRIELGKGMERYISNAQAQLILTEAMIPAFKKGDFVHGLEAGLSRLMKQARRYVVNRGGLPGSR